MVPAKTCKGILVTISQDMILVTNTILLRRHSKIFPVRMIPLPSVSKEALLDTLRELVESFLVKKTFLSEF